MSMTATYSPEDNKLRLYSVSRLPKDLYDRVKAAGFKWAPKQELFVAPSWTPSREDLLLELCGEIDDEDYSVEERAADRAERFGEYRDKRRAEAGGLADRFESGPSAFGHQNLARAERQARRHDRLRAGAVSQWAKAEYWQRRTAGVIASALYKSSAAVRRSRILRLEAEQRKHEKERAESADRFAGWTAVLTMDGADAAGKYSRDDGFAPETVTPALRAAYRLANLFGLGEYAHPRTGRKASSYSLLTDEADPVTPAEAATLWLAGRADPNDPDSSDARWSDHYTNRLAYERAMLAAEGGTAADAEMVPGGWIGKNQIQAVNRSPVTKRVVSVKVFARSGWNGDGPLKLKSFNIERLPEGAYRPPTEEEAAAFATATKERKAAEKAGAMKPPPLLNPTDEDAQRLQDLWNARARQRFETARSEGRVYERQYPATGVKRMTQAEYAARSKGSYGVCETVEVTAAGFRPKTQYGQNADPSPVLFTVRKGYAGTGWTGSADAVIVLIDKPRKPLPLDWAAIESTPTGATA